MSIYNVVSAEGWPDLKVNLWEDIRIMIFSKLLLGVAAVLNPISCGVAR